MLQRHDMGNILNFHEKNRQQISPRLVAKTDDAFIPYYHSYFNTYGMSWIVFTLKT